MFEPDLIGKGIERLAIDVLMIAAAGIVVFVFEQQVVHRRSPLR